jgi:DNA-3-methyladenine glycosylase II
MLHNHPFVMTEHIGWRATHQDRYRVFTFPDGAQWLVRIIGNGAVSQSLTGSTRRPQSDVFTAPKTAGCAVPELYTELQKLGPVARFRTPDLWEAIASAITRQVIRAEQARQLYQAFCDTYGQQIPLPDTYTTVPAAETVLGLRDEDFAVIGMTLKRRPMRAAAKAYLEHRLRWQQLDPGLLVRELQQIPHIGPWTAGAAVADFTNDFTYYPCADLAVRTWARRAVPSFPWPDSEHAFGRLWRAAAGNQLAPLTLLTLAWGNHHADSS